MTPGTIRGTIRTLLATLALIAVSSLEPVSSPALASPMDQCFFGPLNHSALAGMWGADDGYEFAFNIYPCGTISELFWLDQWGNRYQAQYQAVATLPGGGWIGQTYDGGPWWTTRVGYKPAEPGHIQLIFWAPQTPEQLIVRHARRIQ